MSPEFGEDKKPEMDKTSIKLRMQKTAKFTKRKNQRYGIKKVSLETSTELPHDFELNDEFKAAFDLMESTDKHVFVTGKAGTGKSTLLEYFRQNTKKKIVVLAPTGVAAIKVRGQTMHSFFRFPPRFIQEEHVKRVKKEELFKKLDAVVIDEVSMVRADLLDGVDYSLRINRGRYNEPFGGVQVILIGDLFQLPPVVDKEIKDVMEMQYRTPYFFSANVLSRIQLECVELIKIYRQKSADFVKILNKIREKTFAESDLEAINERCAGGNVTYANGIITLTTTNVAARNINEAMLKKINDKEYQYEASIGGKFDEKAYPTEEVIRLKEGAQVILIKNDPNKRWVNGTIGEIEDLSGTHIKVKTRYGSYEVSKVTWENVEYIYNPEKDKIEENVIGSFIQYPLKLAWAITIHKSQGQTFDEVIIDMGYGAFTHGQVYVALSRCRSLEGIRLKKPIIYSDIIFDDRICNFLDLHVKDSKY